ncbi:hypothetical protein PUMCH_002374 [Australozyma saopauloensis]|uniref:Altered inheritance of mitochondria protein 18, mitochondrial n=1 Tax=Australozyma saopauloensis TaxID=291208 RepID=A0AAX4H932_9ASCO|nr:hypothetical protein PUMCH_002374 [[Candida] saopauloensis]
MWGVFGRINNVKRTGAFVRTATARKFSRAHILLASVAAITASLLINGSPILNDVSNRSLDGVEVDSAITPFETYFSSKQLPFLSSDHKLIASGVRSVTFMGFKVYGVGLYISAKDEPKLKSVIQELLKENPDHTVKTLLDDKKLSQDAVDKISQVVPYAVRITPIRNTDFQHMKDGLTKSILANPMAKEFRDAVAGGVEELRTVFQNFRGSFPKNKTLWVISDTKSTKLHNNVKDEQDMGQVGEQIISRVLLVSYLSNLQPLSKPLRENFVSYVTTLVD